MGVRRELLMCLGTALVTTAGLFTLQVWYASYLDVAVVHGHRSNVSLDPKLQALRNEEQAQVDSSQVAIEQAMAALAQRGRGAFPLLEAKPSDDLSAMAGWVHRPGFKPYVPRGAVARAAGAAGAGSREQ
jgi:hypothetical protein